MIIDDRIISMLSESMITTSKEINRMPNICAIGAAKSYWLLKFA